MNKIRGTEPAPIQEPGLPGVYTLEQAASRLGVRADDLALLLPDTAIVLGAQPPLLLSHADVETLERLIGTIRRLYAESAYGGGDL